MDWSTGFASTSVDSSMNQSDVIGFDDPRCMLTKLENSHNQPFVVYLTGESDEATKAQNVLNGQFFDERIGIAAQVTCMIKASGEDLDESHPFWRHVGGDSLPRLVFFAGDGTKIGQLEGNATSGDIYDLMEESFDASYEGSLEKVIKAYQKLLVSMDKVRGKKKLLDDKYLTCETRAEEQKLERELADLEKDAERLRAKKAKILELERRWGT